MTAPYNVNLKRISATDRIPAYRDYCLRCIRQALEHWKRPGGRNAVPLMQNKLIHALEWLDLIAVEYGLPKDERIAGGGRKPRELEDARARIAELEAEKEKLTQQVATLQKNYATELKRK